MLCSRNTLSPRHKIVSVECVVDAVQCNVFHECAVVTPHLLLPPRHITSVQHYNYITTRSVGALWAKTSSWRPIGPLNFVLPCLKEVECELPKVLIKVLFWALLEVLLPGKVLFKVLTKVL